MERNTKNQCNKIILSQPSHNQAFLELFLFLYEVMQHKIPREVKLKIILCDGYKAEWWILTPVIDEKQSLLICDTDGSEQELNLNLLFCHSVSLHFM